MSAEPAVRVELVVRPGCHLCDVARETVESVCRDLGVAWVQTSLDDHPDLVAAYGELIPVTLVDGRRHDYWRVDPTRLRAALQG